jgi:hypothetical protein
VSTALGECSFGADEPEACNRQNRLRDADIDYFAGLTEVDETADYHGLLPSA